MESYYTYSCYYFAMPRGFCFCTSWKKIINSSHESFEFASSKFAKSTRGNVDTSEVEFSEYSSTGKRRMRHVRIIYVRARSVASISCYSARS